jgi:hypothetical protein
MHMGHHPGLRTRRGLRALTFTMIVTLALSLTLAGVADAKSSKSAKRAASSKSIRLPKSQAPAALGATWLANQIVANGGFVKSFGSPDPTNTAYAVLGLHAAKVGGAASKQAMAYLETQLGAALQSDGSDAPGALSYFIMAAVAAGADPRHFGGSAPANNLVARLVTTQRMSGSDAGLFGAQDPSFDGAFREGLALAAMKAAKVKKKNAHVVAAATWLTKQQCANGLWQSYRSDVSVACAPADPDFFTGPDTNSSGMAMQGLAAYGKKPRKRLALASLDAVQTSDGGFSFMAAAGQSSDPDSTAIVIQGLLAFGSKPTKRMWATPNGNPYDALAAFQLGCASAPADRGAFFFPGSSAPNVFATVQAVPAMASKRLPVRKTKKLADPASTLCS